MKVKQIAAILMSSVLVTGLLAGCGSSGSGGDGSSKEGAAGGSGKIELEFLPRNGKQQILLTRLLPNLMQARMRLL